LLIGGLGLSGGIGRAKHDVQIRLLLGRCGCDLLRRQVGGVALNHGKPHFKSKAGAAEIKFFVKEKIYVARNAVSI
jgi:hypothetical protein